MIATVLTAAELFYRFARPAGRRSPAADILTYDDYALLADGGAISAADRRASTLWLRDRELESARIDVEAAKIAALIDARQNWRVLGSDLVAIPYVEGAVH